MKKSLIRIRRFRVFTFLSLQNFSRLVRGEFFLFKTQNILGGAFFRIFSTIIGILA